MCSMRRVGGPIVGVLLEIPLVGQAVPFFVLGEHRLVHQRFLIDADVARIEAQHFMKNAIKLLILAERQPYRVYQVYGRHGLILRIS